jgi:hypothetical protein
VKLDGLPVLHSFAAEAVALVTALAVCEPEDTFVTDSQSIVTTINKRSHFTTRTNSPLLEILKWHAKRIRWHQAHVEKRESERSKWTPDELGNFMADVVAGNQPEVGMVIHHYTWQQLGESIRSLPGVYITGDGLPLIEDPSNYYLRKKAQDYLKKRDWWRDDAGLPAKWAGVDTEAIARSHGFTRRSAEGLCSDIRVIYDKSWHGGNRKKGVLDPELAEEEGKCKACGSNDSMAHSLLECTDNEVSTIRDKMFQRIQEVQDDIEDHPVAKAVIATIRQEFFQDTIGELPDVRPALGAWSEGAKVRLTRRLRLVKDKAFKCGRVRDAAREFYRIAVEHAKQIFTAKRRLEGGRENWWSSYKAPTKHPPEEQI